MMLPALPSAASGNAPMIVPATDIRLILTTTGSRDDAELIARTLVDERLAACVNIIPGLTSIYRWKGDTETAEETLLLIKSTAAHLDRILDTINRIPTYELPEFVVLTPEAAYKPYLDWLLESVSPPN
jgi:periplasmic divalent cation tolerance protein